MRPNKCWGQLKDLGNGFSKNFALSLDTFNMKQNSERNSQLLHILRLMDKQNISSILGEMLCSLCSSDGDENFTLSFNKL